MSDNQAFVLKGKQSVAYELRPIPDVSPYDVLIEVKKTGICGTDVHYFRDGSCGTSSLKSGQDLVLGHESSGVVVKVGSLVTNVKPQDRVTVEFGTICRACEPCREGRRQMCMARRPPSNGTMLRYYARAYDLVHLLPPQLSLEDGALIEPLAVAVHAVANRGAFRTHQSIAVFGCGPIGLMCMAVAKAYGASRIIAVDISPPQLQFAKSYAATTVYQPPVRQPDESSIVYSKRVTTSMMAELGIAERGPKGVGLVVDASGAEVATQTGIRIVKAGGTFVQLGVGRSDVNIDISIVLDRELTVMGSYSYGPSDFPLAIALVAEGRIDLKSLITHRFTFENAHRALEAKHLGKGDDGKTVIKAMVSGPGVSTDAV